MKLSKGTRVRHVKFDMVGIILEPSDTLIGKMVLVDWVDWRKAWCGRQWVRVET